MKKIKSAYSVRAFFTFFDWLVVEIFVNEITVVSDSLS